MDVLSIYYCPDVLRTGSILCKRSDISGVSSVLFMWNLVSITNFLTKDEWEI